MIPSDPIPTLTLPLKGRELLFHMAGMIWHLPFQGGGCEGDGVEENFLVPR
jgi:hypothetical protein